MNFNLDKCNIIYLGKISDPRGNLTFVENSAKFPFKIQRIYYLYDIPGGSERGEHAHKNLHQLIIAVSGSFTVILKDGHSEKEFILNNPSQGLYIAPMVWRGLKHFSSGAVCLVLASEIYDESDYIRDFSLYLRTFK